MTSLRMLLLQLRTVLMRGPEPLQNNMGTRSAHGTVHDAKCPERACMMTNSPLHAAAVGELVSERLAPTASLLEEGDNDEIAARVPRASQIVFATCPVYAEKFLW